MDIYWREDASDCIDIDALARRLYQYLWLVNGSECTCNTYHQDARYATNPDSQSNIYRHFDMKQLRSIIQMTGDPASRLLVQNWVCNVSQTSQASKVSAVRLILPASQISISTLMWNIPAQSVKRLTQNDPVPVLLVPQLNLATPCQFYHIIILNT